MNDFLSKRTARTKLPGQINMDPELKALISQSAERARRTIGMEIIELIVDGFEHRRYCASHGRIRSGSRARATSRNFAQPAAIARSIAQPQQLQIPGTVGPEMASPQRSSTAPRERRRREGAA